MVHGRFSGFGAPVNWIAADIVRIENRILVERWGVIEDEATEEQSKRGRPMFGKTFPTYKRVATQEVRYNSATTEKNDGSKARARHNSVSNPDAWKASMPG
jgi:hypothetical protein